MDKPDHVRMLESLLRVEVDYDHLNGQWWVVQPWDRELVLLREWDDELPTKWRLWLLEEMLKRDDAIDFLTELGLVCEQGIDPVEAVHLVQEAMKLSNEDLMRAALAVLEGSDG